MSCTGIRFTTIFELPWGGTPQPVTPCGQDVVQTVGAVAEGDAAEFADATGRKIRAGGALVKQADFAEIEPLAHPANLSSVRAKLNELLAAAKGE